MRRPLALLIAVSLVVVAAIVVLVREPAPRAIEPAAAADSPDVSAPNALDLADVPREPVRASELPRAAPTVVSSNDRESLFRRAGRGTPSFGPDFAAGVIEARVVDDATGLPFVGAHVIAGRDADHGTQPHRTTDAEGVARFDALAGGAWSVTALADGCITVQAHVALGESAPHALVELRLAVQREVLVRLVDASGRDLALDDLGFTKKDVGVLGPVLGGSCCEPGERFVLRDPPSHRALGGESSEHPFRWRFEIRGRAPACVHVLVGDLVLASQPLDPRAAEALIRVDRSAIERAVPPIVVHVVADEDGVGIAGARVEFRISTGPALELVTDGEGRARAESLLAGDVRVFVRADARAAQTVTARRPIDGEIVVRVRSARSIGGIVFDGDEKPIAEIPVSAYAIDGIEKGRVARSAGTAITGADGRYRFEGLPAGRYVLRANSARDTWSDVDVDALPFDAEAADCRGADVPHVVLRGVRTRRIDVEATPW